jgi:hypothetical protein
MKTTHKIAYAYAQAFRHQSINTQMLDKAFGALGSDNQIFSLAEPIETAYTDLVLELLGPELFEWVMWWMYETEFGTKDMEFLIDGSSYSPTNMTMYSFLEAVDASN